CITYLAAQTKITTAAAGNVGYNGTNYIGGNTTITFVIQNNSSNDIVLTDVEDFKATNGPGFPLNTGSFNLWYSATSLSGDPGLISIANWTKINGETPVAVTLVPGYNTIFSNLSFIIPANTTYRFALESFTGLAYSGGLTPGLCSPSTLTKDSVSLILGDAAIAGQSVGYAGSYPNSSYTNSWFTGSITFHTAQPCIAPPNAGNTVSVTTDTCAGFPFKLDLSGQSVGVGQTYQWQSSINNTSYTNIAGATESSLKTSQLVSTYYRCAVTCSGLTSYSTPLQITTPISVSGIYTINSGTGTGGSNFATFTEAIDFIKCGINGPVVFNVVTGSGPYNEQIKLPFIGGASSVNTVTFNGNGEKLIYNASTATNKAIVTFDNASHIIMDSLTIDGLTGAYNWNILFTNKSDSNIIRKCNIINNNTSTSLVNNICILLNGSSQFLATSSNNANYNVIEKNTINGGAYGIYMYGSGVNTENIGNIIQNNTIQDFYNSGIYVANGLNDLVISKNDIYRPSRSNTATSINGINTTNTCLNMLIEKNKIHNLFDAILSNTATCYAFNIGANGATAKETKLNNNIVYNMNGYGALYGINNSANYLQAFHNTIVLDEFSSFSGAAYGFVQASGFSNVDFSNNIISITRNSTGKHRCLNIANTSNITSCRN
ncbi:MAG: hypothetical protein NTZ59_06890, partial [Bacteroidetes bacterium]|nr:hypothetical protein [Bacteroidota bacterium]